MDKPVPVESASALIDGRIKELGDWRGETLAKVREIIHKADPEIVEEWKWMGTPIWSHGGIVCTGETYRNAVKMTFHKGAALVDPSRLFNASLDGNARRAIDLHEVRHGGLYASRRKGGRLDQARALLEREVDPGEVASGYEVVLAKGPGPRVEPGGEVIIRYADPAMKRPAPADTEDKKGQKEEKKAAAPTE